MVDAIGAQQSMGVAHALGAARLTGVHSAAQARRTCASNAAANRARSAAVASLPSIESATTRGCRRATSTSTSSAAESDDCVRNRLMHKPTGGSPSCSASVNPASMALIMSGKRPCHAVQWVGLTITSA